MPILFDTPDQRLAKLAPEKSRALFRGSARLLLHASHRKPIVVNSNFGVQELVPANLDGKCRHGDAIRLHLAGLPALPVPCGFTKEGLPIGMQIIARAWADAKPLNAGYAFEQATEWHKQRPTLI